MNGPDPLDAAFAWLDSHRGIGKPGDVHAGVLKAYMDRLAHEWRQMRNRAEQADRRIRDLAAQVQAALDDTNPDQAGALVRFMAAVNELPAVKAARFEVPAPRRSPE